MSNSSKRIVDLSPGEKRALLTKLFQEKASAPLRLLDQFVMSTTALQTEAILDPTIRPETGSVEPGTEPAHIFLTGATGFLGAFLLYALLQHTTANIYCLVRAATAEEGKQRLHGTLASYALWHEGLSPRIIPVVGDLSEPLFGLSADHFSHLASQIDIIYHNGAFVNWIYPYNRLKPTNVLGTQEALRLASQNRLKPVHFISTFAVFPLFANSEVKAIREQDSLDHGGVLYGGYTQSKWVAEKLVTIARSRGIPVCIYRPAFITGHSQTGVWNTDDVIGRIIKSLTELGSAPEVETSLNMIPVDYVSQAIVHLSRQKEARGKVFHLVNSSPVQWRELFTWIRSFGYPLRPIPYNQWRAKLIDLGHFQDNTAAYNLMPLFSVSPSKEGARMVRNMPEFDCQNTLDGLAGTSIVCPLVDSHVLEAYFSYFIRRGFLDAPPLGGTFRSLSNATSKVR